jgi:hypothetical protein
MTCRLETRTAATSGVVGAQVICSELGDMEVPAGGGDLVRGAVPHWPGRRWVPWLWREEDGGVGVWWRGIVGGTRCGAGPSEKISQDSTVIHRNGQLFWY